MEEGARSLEDWTAADWDAEVERFLKKGTREASFDGSWDGEGDDATELSLLWPEEEPIEVSEPVRERVDVSDLGMSPKYCSERLTASSWGTPAKATTILSGR